jgi:hypothetical protein
MQPTEGYKLEIMNYENTVLFLVSSFQYILVAAVFSIGAPYRQPMWSNGTFDERIHIYQLLQPTHCDTARMADILHRHVIGIQRACVACPSGRVGDAVGIDGDSHPNTPGADGRCGNQCLRVSRV